MEVGFSRGWWSACMTEAASRDLQQSPPSRRMRSGAASLFAAVLVGLAFAGPLLSGERFYFRDVSQNHGPAIEAARALLRSGDPPWWNPWAGGGKPLIANPNNLLMTPAG